MNDDRIAEADDWITPAEADDWITPAESGPVLPRTANPTMRRAQPIEGFDDPEPAPEPPPPPDVWTAPTPQPAFETAFDRQARVIPQIVDLGRVPDRGDIIRDEGRQQAAAIDAIRPQDYANPPLTYEEATLSQRAGEQLRGGVDAAIGGLAGFNAARVVQELDILDRADRGEELPRNRDGSASIWQDASPQVRARARAIRERQLANSLRTYLNRQAAAAARLRNPRIEQLAQAVDSGEYGAAWRIFASDPAGILQQLSVESLPHSVAPLALGIAGGLAGVAPGLAAVGLGSLASDVGPRFVEMLGEAMKGAGIDTQNPEAVAGYFRANPGKIGELRTAASRGASVVALTEILTFGAARGIRPGAGALRNTGRVAGNMGREIGWEGVGEAGAQMASTGQVQPSEVLFEMLGAAPQVAGTTAFGTIQELRERVPVRQPAPTAPPVPGAPSAPLAPPATPSPPAGVPPQAGTPPPPSVAAPVPAPTTGPSAPTGAAAPAISPAPSPDLLPPAGAPTAVSPNSGAVGPAGGAAPAPPSATTSADGATPPSAPAPGAALPPPPPVNTGRTSLEGYLAAPTPEQQAAIDARRQATVQQWQAMLPPGFTVTDDGDFLTITQPDGDVLLTTEPEPGQDTMEQAAQVARDMVAQGLFPQVTAATQPFGQPDQVAAAQQLAQQARPPAAPEAPPAVPPSSPADPPAVAAPPAATTPEVKSEEPAGPASWWDALDRQERRRIASAAGVRAAPAAAWASFTPETQARLEAARNAPTSQPQAADVTPPAPPPSESRHSAPADVTPPAPDVTDADWRERVRRLVRRLEASNADAEIIAAAENMAAEPPDEVRFLILSQQATVTDDQAAAIHARGNAAVSREDAEGKLLVQGSFVAPNGDTVGIVRVRGGGWVVRFKKPDGRMEELGGDPRGGGFSRDEAIARALRDVTFPQQQPEEQPPSAPPEQPTEGEGTPDQAEAEAPAAGGSELRRLAQAFGGLLIGGRRFASIGQARQEAARILGRAIQPNSADAKLVDEAVELGVVMAARMIVRQNRADPQRTFDLLVKLYEQQPALTTRSSDSIERQAYSTPAPLAWLASEMAGIRPGRSVYEPTAGTGMLLIGSDPKDTIANELDPTRRAALEAQGFEPRGENAVSYQPDGGKNDVIIANPPFGAVKGADGQTRRYRLDYIQEGYETGEVDHAIALRALDAMKDDGDAVLILGGLAKTITGDEARADAYNRSKAKREFFYVLYQAYRVVDHFTVAGELYQRQGAGWPVDVIVIRGRGRSDRRLPSQQAPRIYSTWDSLGGLLDGRDDGRVAAAEQPAPGVEPAGEQPRAGERAPDARAPDGPDEAPAVSVPADQPRDVDGGAGAEPGGSGPGADAADGGPRSVGSRPPRGRTGRAGAATAGGQPGVAGLPEPGDRAAGSPVQGADGAGGRPGSEGDDARGMDQLGVPADGRPDLDALFDDVLNEEFGAPPPPAATPAPAAPRDTRTTGEVAGSAAKNTLRGLGDIAASLESILLPKDGKISSNPVFDPEQYARVLPLLKEAVRHFRDAWGDVKELMRRAIRALTEAIPEDRRRQFAEALRPYITRFAGEVQAGTVQLEDQQQQDEAPAPPAPPRERKPRQQDEETARQVAYKPRADADGVGTLVPVNMQTAVSRALERAEQRAGKPLVEFVGERLGYTPEEVRRYFSAEQVDAIALGINNLDDGAGFVIGDQTGVGKGRFVAAMIRYAQRQGLIPVFVTEKPNLYRDMARDLTDIGMPQALEQILPTNAALNLPLSDEAEGPRLRTPDARQHNEALSAMSPADLLRERRIVFTSYSQMQQIAETDTPRIRFMRAIAPQAFLILDESHNAGGAAKGEVGQKIADKKGKQDRGTLFRSFLRDARAAVYSSATWAKRPDVMDLYGIKTDMKLAVPSLDMLAQAIQRGGVPMQQIVSAMMADSGQYIRRERSFAGVTYDLEPIAVDRDTYDGVASALARIFELSGIVAKAAKEMDKELKAEAKRLSPDGSTGGAGVESTNFGAVMHNLINQMLLASKAPGTVKLALDRLKAGEKPVIAVANTMGSFIEEYASENDAKPGDRLDLTFNTLLERYLRRTLRLTERRPFMKKGEKAKEIWLTPEQLGPEGEAKYRAAERLIRSLNLEQFPLSPIDYIRSELMRAGYRVGEITGRTEAADYRADGGVYYRKRPQKETTPAGRLDAIRRFNAGSAAKPLAEAERIDVMVLNQSGATGLSLHASATFGDRSKRVMIIAQAEGNIDTHMQMLGRVHRTGQVVTPAYLQLVADVPAEKRPAAVLAKKMASLAAATTSNRRGALAAEDSPDFLNEYGDEVVVEIVEQDPALYRLLGKPDLRDENDNPDDAARRVTGRIPLLPLAKQEELYAEIEKRYRRAIEIADEQGTNTLEAKTLDLDARLIEERPWTEGKGPRLFEGEAKIGRYEVKRQSRPPAPYTIMQRIADALGESVNGDAIKKMSFDDLADALARTARGTSPEDWHAAQVRFVDRTHAALQKGAQDRLEGKERAKAIERIDDQRARLRAVLDVAQPGHLITVQQGDDPARAAVVMAVTAPDKGSALAPSRWEMTVLFDDGTRLISNLSSVFTPQNRPQSGDDATRLVPIVIDTAQTEPDAYRDFFAQVQAQSGDRREERWIVTGNLLAGFARRQGQIANFYTQDGDLLQGIIMPATFNLDEFEAGALPRFDWEQAAAFLSDRAVSLPMIETMNGKVRVARTDRGDFVVTTPISKAEGADWYLDPAVRATVQGGDFVGRSGGGEMRATVAPERIRDAMRALGRIATVKRQDWISKTPGAKEWLQAAARRSSGRPLNRNLIADNDPNRFSDDDDGPPRGGMPLYSSPFDPALFDRIIMRPLREALGSSTALTRVARAVRDRDTAALRRIWKGAPSSDQIRVTERTEADDLGFWKRWLATPRWAYRKFPALARLVEAGIRAEENYSVWSKRLEEQYERLRKTLDRGRGDWGKVQRALWAADADEVDIENAEQAKAWWEAQGLNAAEATAAAAMNRLLVKQARLVDQHRRAMMPKVREQKAHVWESMKKVLATKGVPTEEYGKLYRRRSYLNARIRDGKGDLGKQAAEVASINAQLVQMREGDPAVQALLGKLQEEYDAMEARLAATTVRRRQGYVPHKFYGSWRLFREFGTLPDGTKNREELTSDQGFYDSRGQAIAAAERYLAEHPDASLTVEPRLVTFPGDPGGATLTDAAYGRLKRDLEEAAGDSGITLAGIAKVRSRRRTFAPAMFRSGAKGFSADLDRVMRTHIRQTARYVTMDRLKFAYVTTTESLGLSPYRPVQVKVEGQAQLQAAIESWWTDVNGAKQDHEDMLDRAFQRMGVTGSTLAALLPGLLVMPSAPVTGAALAGYLGWRAYRAMTKGGEFPTRAMVQGITSDMAHLKLGMALNLGSAMVNLSQTLINTLPLMGPKWTAIGAQRAAAALWSQARNADAPGRMSNDAHLLTRADIRTAFRYAQDAGFADRAQSKLSKISMWAFEGAERLNRATAFMAAHAKAEAEGKSPAEALEAGKEMLRRTQFHGGQANRPEIIRTRALQVPLQFKNFLLQQIAFFFGLERKQMATMLVMLALLGGALALAGFQFLDWLTDLLTGIKPSDAVAEWIADAQRMGDLQGTAAHVLARGLPALLGLDISQRIGMGAGFLPDQGSDFYGPFVSTVMQVREAERQRAQLVDTMLAITPGAMPLKVLEAAANGTSITNPGAMVEGLGDGRAVWTNPRKRGNEEIEPTTGELIARGTGLQPARWTNRTALERRQLDRVADRRKDENAYLAEIIQARRNGQPTGPIIQEARRAGVNLTQQRIVRAVRDADTDRVGRAMRQAPRQDRPEFGARVRAIDELGGAR